jgi:hypothetical protein
LLTEKFVHHTWILHQVTRPNKHLYVIPDIRKKYNSDFLELTSAGNAFVSGMKEDVGAPPSEAQGQYNLFNSDISNFTAASAII